MRAGTVNKPRVARLICGYQVVLVLVALAVNVFGLPHTALDVAVPARPVIMIATVACGLLLLNHMWLMTATELARLRHDLSATPEERAQRGLSRDAISPEAGAALERCHNAHRNTTENMVYFGPLAGLFVLTSPSVWAAGLWLIGFAVGRLGYTFAYLSANTALRGVCMSVGLLGLYGLLCNLILSAFY